VLVVSLEKLINFGVDPETIFHKSLMFYPDRMKAKSLDQFLRSHVFQMVGHDESIKAQSTEREVDHNTPRFAHDSLSLMFRRAPVSQLRAIVTQGTMSSVDTDEGENPAKLAVRTNCPGNALFSSEILFDSREKGAALVFVLMRFPRHLF
jgi:hypothetical protein